MFLELNEGLQFGIIDNFENYVWMRGILDVFIIYL